MHIHIWKTHSAKVFSNAKGNRSVGTFFHHISKKNIVFFSNKAQHLRRPLELENLFYWIKTNSVKSDILSLVTDVTQNSGRALYLNFFLLLVLIKKCFLQNYHWEGIYSEINHWEDKTLFLVNLVGNNILTQTHGLASEMDSIAKAVLYAGWQCTLR